LVLIRPLKASDACALAPTKETATTRKPNVTSHIDKASPGAKESMFPKARAATDELQNACLPWLDDFEALTHAAVDRPWEVTSVPTCVQGIAASGLTGMVSHVDGQQGDAIDVKGRRAGGVEMRIVHLIRVPKPLLVP